MQDEVLAVVKPSAPRRWFGVGTLLLLGTMLIYLAFAAPPQALGWQGFLLGFGGVSLWLAETTRRATLLHVELTRDGLRASDGEPIARIDEIDAVNRGVFAMKPSNGFTLLLKAPRARRWRPGLWWALGRRVGIGGVTPGAQSKAMAQMIEVMMVERSQADHTS